jgi:PAS domain-containing protein
MNKTICRNEDGRLRIAALAVGVSLYDWHIQRRVISMDDYAGVVGPAGEKVEMSRSTWEASLHPDDKERMTEAFRLMLEHKDPHKEVEYRIRSASGYRWVMDRSSIVEYTKEGYPRKVGGIIMDHRCPKTALKTD